MPVEIRQQCWGCREKLPRDSFSSGVSVGIDGKKRRKWSEYCKECEETGKADEPAPKRAREEDAPRSSLLPGGP